MTYWVEPYRTGSAMIGLDDFELSFEYADGSAVEGFATDSEKYPDGVYYRLQYYDADGTILRYDNAHDSDVGPHHRHIRTTDGEVQVTGIEFDGFQAHVSRFLDEVNEIHAQR